MRMRSHYEHPEPLKVSCKLGWMGMEVCDGGFGSDFYDMLHVALEAVNIDRY